MVDFNDVFRYDDGKLYWIINKNNHVRCGVEAGSEIDRRGYRRITHNKVRYRTHRVIWEMFNGSPPRDQIDHIDGDPKNNRIENLREVDNQGNQRNARINSKNTSGIIGVYWHERDNNWRARITVNNIKISLGGYKHKVDAIIARKNAEVDYGFHTNHGRR